jgi:DNA helicase-2/ATP-dependent DNA helicase PcrA
MSHSSELNPQQKEAAEHLNGPLLIVAGAGAGKTKTLSHRILELVRSGIEPRKILAITFTNKAAAEMRERVRKLLDESVDVNRPVHHDGTPFLSTFHSLGVHILRENARLLGLPARFTIFDRSDSKQAIKEAMRLAGFDPKQFDPGKVLGSISKEKGEGRTLERFINEVRGDFWKRLIEKTWEHYNRILKEEGALDFDDLLLTTAELLRGNDEVRAKYQSIWSHIHIDEYQDTNKVQYSIARSLTGPAQNICVVGDADQMIYSWRGARIDNILDFEKDFPGAKVVLLEENYRSTKTIIDAANEIIRHNRKRKEKNLFTKNSEGEAISLYSAYDEADEAQFVARMAKKLMSGGVGAQHIAVLFRANFQSRVLEEAFLSEDIPYQIIGTRFFERKEVKDVLSFIKAAFNPQGLSDIKRIINVPARGIGKVTILKIFEKKEIPGATGEKVKAFFTLLTSIREYASSHKPSETVKFVLRETGMERMYKEGKEEDTERLENIRELATLAVRYDLYTPEEGISKLLEDAALAADQDEIDDNVEKVKLMTVHASKGLEFEYVFITGLEGGLFPHGGMGDSEERDEEEERRLMYVALTRARKKIFLSHASVRTIFGSRQVTLPSEFLSDIPDHLMQSEQGQGLLRTIYLE